MYKTAGLSRKAHDACSPNAGIKNNKNKDAQLTPRPQRPGPTLRKHRVYSQSLSGAGTGNNILLEGSCSCYGQLEVRMRMLRLL